MKRRDFFKIVGNVGAFGAGDSFDRALNELINMPLEKIISQRKVVLFKPSKELKFKINKEYEAKN